MYYACKQDFITLHEIIKLNAKAIDITYF